MAKSKRQQVDRFFGISADEWRQIRAMVAQADVHGMRPPPKPPDRPYIVWEWDPEAPSETPLEVARILDWPTKGRWVAHYRTSEL
jgi:hypothetical protein